MGKTDQQYTGKVIRTIRKQYAVALEDGRTLLCSVRGRLVGLPSNHQGAVKVGDDVLVRLISEEEGVIEEILPRKSKISRAVEGKAYREHIIATNVDQMVIIMAAKEPPFKSGLLDRYLVIAEKNHLQALICLNKIDLANREEFADYLKWYPQIGCPIILTSAVTGEGIEEFKQRLKGKVSALVGHSGVGKTSLIQKIEPGLDLKTGPTSKKTGKGRHTTTYVELYPLSFGGYIIDTPGIRELGLWDIYRSELKQYFVDFRPYEEHCQFADCNHIQEPGCAVKEAVEKGEIFAERYDNYVNIYLSLRSAPYELLRPR